MRHNRFLYFSLVALVLAVAFTLIMRVAPSPALAAGKLQGSGVAAQLQAEFAAVAEMVNPTVVNIDVTKTVEAAGRGGRGGGRGRGGGGGPDFFRGFPHPGLPGFEGFRRQPQREAPKVRGAGSGVIIDAQKGYILTNNHVIDGADEIGVTLIDGQRVTAKLKGADPRTDIAVIQIETDGLELEEIEWGDSDALAVGHWVLAFGQPEGLRYTVTAGIVSAKGRVNLGIIGRPGGIGGYEDFIQTDAAINPGNSGGPLTDINGRLVGINTAIATNGARQSMPQFMGISFAVPSNLARSVADQLIEKGEVVRGWLGIVIHDFADAPPQEVKQSSGNDKADYGDLKAGAYIRSVEPGQPAEAAGIRNGDVLVRYNGEQIADHRLLRSLVADTAVGAKVKVTVVRVVDGKVVEKELVVTIAKQPKDLAKAVGAPGVVSTKLGIFVQTLTRDMARAFGIDGGGAVVTHVDPKGRAAKADIKRGDVITEVRHKGTVTEIISAHAFKSAVDAVGEDESLVIARSRWGQAKFVTIK